MPYYQGDFYGPAGRGGYYRGDPGFLGFLGGFARAAVGMIPGVGGALARIIPTGAARALPAAGGGMVARAGAAIVKHPVLSAAAAAGTVGALGGGVGMMAGRAGMVPAGHRGYHIEKRGKHAGQLIKNRRMNPYNPRALHRAIRRAHSFSRMAVKILRFTHPRKVRGRPYFAKKRRRAA